ncbi:microtubule-associated protein TORTIFOLIA1 [Apium graveolens]|uniref:microtubule-associated protein TORTIFOLIA1 n=1 Tax=Apium graveolens TaxID=4045 RepID=UPI003D7B5CB3
MGSQAPKSSKPLKPSNQTPPSRTSSSSLSSHLAMIELKQRILTSLSKLSDRDTHQIAVEDLEKIIQTLSSDGISMLLNCLFDATNDPKPAVKKESLRLLSVLCAAHGDSAATHLTKIIGHIVKKLKDSDSGVRDSCKDAIGALSSQYLKGGNGENGSIVSLFAKPLFESMNDQSKVVQAASAMCLAKMVDCATDPPIAAFQKLCPRICKYLNSPNFLAKAAILPVVASLSQVGAIAPQNLETMMNSIHDSLSSTDWATRKAAADALVALALHSSNLIKEIAPSTLEVLEARRFDKIKPVRDSLTEALQLWKMVAGKGEDGPTDDPQSSVNDADTSGLADVSKRHPNSGERRTCISGNNSAGASPSTDSVSKAKGSNFLDRTAVMLKKKAPALSDKELNPEFFQKLKTRGSGAVEVVVARRRLKSSDSHSDDEAETTDTDARKSRGNCEQDVGSINSNLGAERGNSSANFCRQPEFDDQGDANQRKPSANRVGISKTDAQSEGFMNNKGNWLAIQRQLLQLERQQAHLMNMLQDFMGGSHDGMLTLENRVRGLERVIEDMAHDLTVSGRRGGNYMMGFEESNRHLGKYSGFSDYNTISKFARAGDGRSSFGERFAPSDGVALNARGRGLVSWRNDLPESRDYYSYGRNGQIGSRRGLGSGPMDGRSPKSDHGSDQSGSRRAWDKGVGPVRFDEGPSARSVWQASKDEATLEAIRVAGEDNGKTRTARVAECELTAEALGDDNAVPDRDPIWTSWSNAMDALHVGDMDSAFAEVLSAGDDLLLVKLMDRSGPVIDQLSSEVANEVLHAVAQFLFEQNLFDICLSWIQQLVDFVGESGPDVLGTTMEVKREILLNLNEASSTIDPPEDWEGVSPDQLLLQLASAWEIDLQQLEK